MAYTDELKEGLSKLVIKNLVLTYILFTPQHCWFFGCKLKLYLFTGGLAAPGIVIFHLFIGFRFLFLVLQKTFSEEKFRIQSRRHNHLNEKIFEEKN